MINLPPDLPEGTRILVVDSDDNQIAAQRFFPKNYVIYPGCELHLCGRLDIQSLAAFPVTIWPTAGERTESQAEYLAGKIHSHGQSVKVLRPNGSAEGLCAASEYWQVVSSGAAEILKWAHEHIHEFTPPPEPPVIEEPPLEAYERPDADDWGVPLDLWTEHPVPRLKPEWLPSALREYVIEQSDLTGTDPTIIGLSCLVACAGCINDGFRVQPKAHDTTWTESARIWGAIVGDPASKKSPGIATAIKPVRKIDNRLGVAYADEYAEYEQEFEQWQRSKAKDKGPPPKKPKQPRVMVENTTIEALSDILKDNEQGVLAFHDELSGWFGSMDVYGKAGSSKDRALWLEAYNGGPKRIDRVTRGHLFVPNWSVSLLGGIQPDVFSRIVSKLDSDGLLQRFMVVIGHNAKDDIDRQADQRIIQDYADLIEDLQRLRPNSSEGEVYRLSDEAQEIRKAFMIGIKGLIQSRAVPDPMVGYLGKWEGLFARLLCVYHMVDAVIHHKRPADLIEGETAMTVASFMECLLFPHARQFYEEMVVRTDRDRHIKWIAGYILASGVDSLATRDILRFYKVFTKASDADRRSTWNALQDGQWVRQAPNARVNRQTGIPTQWEVNPIIKSTFSTQREVEKTARAAAKEAIAAYVQRLREDELSDNSLSDK